MLTGLTSVDRNWASSNVRGLSWDELTYTIVAHFESPVLKDRLFKELMSIQLGKKESVQHYCDQLKNLMRRTGKTDDDAALIAVFIGGLDDKLQEMMLVARAMNQTVWRRHSNGPLTESITWEVQNAIALDAARKESTRRSTTRNTEIVRCGKCGKKGHTTAEHRDPVKPNPEEDSKKKEREEDRRLKRCFKCKQSWEKGHKCEKKNDKNDRKGEATT